MNVKQLKILSLLIRKSGQRYSELFRHFEYEDKFPYHLKQLLKNDLLLKKDNGYYISKAGITYTTKFNSRTLTEIEPKTHRFLFVCKNEDKFAIRVCFASDKRREKYYIMPGGNPLFGQSIKEACAEFMKNKFSLKGSCEYRATHHYRNYTTDGELLYDNICLVFDVDVTKSSRKFVKWFTKCEISKLSPRHPTIDLYILKNDKTPFTESKFIYDYGFEK